MKSILYGSLAAVVLLTNSCVESEVHNPLPMSEQANVMVPVSVPDTTVEKSLLRYDNKTSQWSLNGKLYSGYMVSFYPDGNLKGKIGILEGKQHDQSAFWFADGHLKRIANYQGGKLHGQKKSWTDDSSHILIAELQYHSGYAHGAQTQWYQTGEVYKKLNLNMGREEGLQQAFRKNGELYANYEAKNGRTFGLQKASLCYGLEKEKINYDQ